MTEEASEAQAAIENGPEVEQRMAWRQLATACKSKQAAERTANPRRQRPQCHLMEPMRRLHGDGYGHVPRPLAHSAMPRLASLQWSVVAAYPTAGIGLLERGRGVPLPSRR